MVIYSNLRLVLFHCFWIPPNMWGSVSTICQDEHGFWLVNFACRLPPMEEPYVIPASISQVIIIFPCPQIGLRLKSNSPKMGGIFNGLDISGPL